MRKIVVQGEPRPGSARARAIAPGRILVGAARRTPGLEVNGCTYKALMV